MVPVIGSRLSSLYGKIRPDVALPVLIITEQAPDAALIQTIERTGNARSTFKSALGHVIGIYLTQDAASAVAKIPGVRAIQYDEPIVTIKRLFGAW